MVSETTPPAVEHQLCGSLLELLEVLAPSAHSGPLPWLARSLEVVSRRGSLHKVAAEGSAVTRR